MTITQCEKCEAEIMVGFYIEQAGRLLGQDKRGMEALSRRKNARAQQQQAQSS
jgi:hypothetical protein